MRPKLITIILLIVSALTSKADTIEVVSHQHVNMVWHENYDKLAYFPTKDKSFQKILMYYTLGCATGGCSDWDYDVNTYIMHNTKSKDSTVAKLDTISEAPLLVDTTWNVFTVYEPFELGRFITPYGSYMNYTNPSYKTGGFDSSWSHTFVYDVTDYATLLKDSVLIRSQYNGWSSGFSATIKFVFVEGTPQRNVVGIKNIYTKGGGYQSSAQFETNIIPAKTIDVPPGANQAQAKVIITGHGANSAEGCAEFCDKNYYLKVNGETKFSKRMWRDDCGAVAVRPQGGTYLYSRGNWCPGDKVHEDRYELTPYLTGDKLTVDMDIEPYVLAGSGGSSHSISCVVFFYGPSNYDTDAELHTILAPSDFSEHLPWNPNCSEPIVVIRNNGHEKLTYAEIEYGPVHGNKIIFPWTGNLGFQEMDTVFLPAANWEGVELDQSLFSAKLVNQFKKFEDQNASNDEFVVTTASIPRLEPFRILMRTNGFPQENRLTITDINGNEVFVIENMSATTVYNEEVNLEPGCYQLLLTDSENDGLDWWVYRQQGNANRSYGYIRLYKQSGGIYEDFGGDFGNEIRYQFIVGEQNSRPITEHDLVIGPNPTDGNVRIRFPKELGAFEVLVVNSLGQTVYNQEVDNSEQFNYYDVSLGDVNSGLYVFKLTFGDREITKKLTVVNK